MKYLIKSINDYNKREIDNFYNLIPSIKKEKIDKYKISKSKIQSIIGEILLKKLLNNKNIDYYYNKDGKPYLKNSNLFFNISHSYDYVITTISSNEIGVDIEKIRKTPLNTINKFATDKEKEYILSTKENIEERLFKIYTLKEAYFKAQGTNLNDILKIEFIINNQNISCSDKSVKVGFINDIDGYVIAYCEKL